MVLKTILSILFITVYIQSLQLNYHEELFHTINWDVCCNNNPPPSTCTNCNISSIPYLPIAHCNSVSSFCKYCINKCKTAQGTSFQNCCGVCRYTLIYGCCYSKTS